MGKEKLTEREKIMEKEDMLDRTISVETLPKSCFVSRGATTFDIFRGGVSPVETDPGQSIGSRRRMEPSTVFLIAD